MTLNRQCLLQGHLYLLSKDIHMRSGTAKGFVIIPRLPTLVVSRPSLCRLGTVPVEQLSAV